MHLYLSCILFISSLGRIASHLIACRTSHRSHPHFQQHILLFAFPYHFVIVSCRVVLSHCFFAADLFLRLSWFWSFLLLLSFVVFQFWFLLAAVLMHLLSKCSRERGGPSSNGQPKDQKPFFGKIVVFHPGVTSYLTPCIVPRVMCGRFLCSSENVYDLTRFVIHALNSFGFRFVIF